MPPAPRPPEASSEQSEAQHAVNPETAYRARECTQEFQEHLWSIARKLGRRRGTKNPDETDIDQAYRHLMRHQRRSLIWNIAASVVVIVGAAVTGYGVNLLTKDPAPQGSRILAIAGLVISSLGESLRHLLPD